MASSSSTARTVSSSSTVFPLDDLPDGILAEIFACVSEFQPIPRKPLVDLHNIRAVSRKFRRLAYDTKVLQRAKLHDERWQMDGILYYPIIQSRKFEIYEFQYHEFLQLCIKANNPQAEDAVFQLGVLQYFHSGGVDYMDRQERGISNLKFAVVRGVDGAAEVYGVFLLTLGQADEAYKVLAPYRIELTEDSVRNLLHRWRNHVTCCLSWKPWGRRTQYISRTYFDRRGSCQCDGLTTRRLEKGDSYHSWPEIPLPTSLACEVCQWHFVIYIAFRLWDWRS